MKQLVLATRNKDKVAELTPLLAGMGVELLSLDQFPGLTPVEEDQETLEGNALKKARAVFRETSLPALADDSGLEVYYLNKEPGVYSSRYAGASASYAHNCRKLLNNLKGVPPRRRAARFRCVIAFVAPGGIEHWAEGILPGRILESPRGAHGFGYDPIFLPTGYNQTLAEMSTEFKNGLSHRARAIGAMQPALATYFASHQ